MARPRGLLGGTRIPHGEYSRHREILKRKKEPKLKGTTQNHEFCCTRCHLAELTPSKHLFLVLGSLNDLTTFWGQSSESKWRTEMVVARHYLFLSV